MFVIPSSSSLSIKVRFAQHIVVFRHGALSLIDLDQHAWLVICVGCEGLRFLRLDGGVTCNQLGHHTAIYARMPGAIQHAKSNALGST